MKTILIIAMMSMGLTCIAQKKITPAAQTQKVDSSRFSFELSELEKMTLADYEVFKKNIESLQKEVSIREDEHKQFVGRMLLSRKLPPERISFNGDSVKISSERVEGILRKIKKK